MQRHLKNFYTKLVFKKIGKMSQLILQFMKHIEKEFILKYRFRELYNIVDLKK